jgi:hypothetical protein
VSTLQKIALMLVLLLTGLVVGLQMLMLMGVLPAIARSGWRAMPLCGRPWTTSWLCACVSSRMSPCWFT